MSCNLDIVSGRMRWVFRCVLFTLKHEIGVSYKRSAPQTRERRWNIEGWIAWLEARIVLSLSYTASWEEDRTFNSYYLGCKLIPHDVELTVCDVSHGVSIKSEILHCRLICRHSRGWGLMVWWEDPTRCGKLPARLRPHPITQGSLWRQLLQPRPPW